MDGHRCRCGDTRVIVFFEGRAWCRTCALFSVVDGPAEAFFAILGEPMPRPGIRIVGQRVAA